MSRTLRQFAAWLILGALSPAGCAFLSSQNPESVPRSDERLVTNEIIAVERRWTYHEYKPTTAGVDAPVVVVLHGSGGTGDAALVGDGWLEAAEVGGFCVAAPDALPLRPDERADFLVNPPIWNVGPVVAGTRRAEIDDMLFFDALREVISGVSSGEPRRVFIAGHSGGASMAFRLARERPEHVAAIVAVAGLYWHEGGAATPAVPTLFVTGEEDPLLPMNGGRQGLLWLERATPPIHESLARWAASTGCAGTAEAVSPDMLGLTSTAVRMERFGECGEAELIVAYISGHGHRWPGGRSPELPEAIIGPSRKDVSATEIAVRFFARHAAAAVR